MTEGTWALVLPLKRLEWAKTRLDADPVHRAQLALAMASDTVEAALAVGAVAEVLVATDDPTLDARVRELGAQVVPGLGGLNEALARGAETASGQWPHLRVAALAGDLPALRPAELAEALAQASVLGRSCVGDSASYGTTLLAAAPGARLAPAFGDASFARHVAGGATPLSGSWPGLRRDVDTADDLAEAVRLGVGRRTEEALA